MNAIIDLQEISPNNWKAKYQGNFGVYTIKIETDGKKANRYSCSCPSNYNPCKHIPIVQNAIIERINKGEKRKEKNVFEDVVRKTSLSNLQDFVLRFGAYNNTFQQAFLLEFVPKQKQSAKEATSDYAEIIREELEMTDFDYDDLYNYDYALEIDILDEWFKKAEECADENNFGEAVSIAKACIEEYADWLNEADSEIVDHLGEHYISEPFDILERAKEQGYLSAHELMNYCRKEAAKAKYKNTGFDREFDDLIMELTADIDPAAYIAMQDSLLEQISNKSSYKAQLILGRKINFYKERGEPEKAWEIIENNIQIENYRKEVVEKLIGKQEFSEAKKLINDFLEDKDNNRHYNMLSPTWHNLLLEIAQLENDINRIRKYALYFLENNFEKKYYDIYKSTFAPEAWPAEMENLIEYYRKKDKKRDKYLFSSHDTNVADLLVAENLSERLINYLEQNYDIDMVEKYHRHIAGDFPEKTLALFKKALDIFMEKNTGRNSYESAARRFDSMLKLEGGKEVVAETIEQSKSKYKTRRALQEIFSNYQKKL